MRSTGLATDRVSQYQKLQHDKHVQQFHDWTHCAIYMGQGIMMDTHPSRGAKLRRVFAEAKDREIAVRRVDPAVASADECLRVAEIAATLEDAPYISYLSAILGTPGYRNQPSNGVPTKFVCSSLVAHACEQAGLPLSLAPGFMSEMLPASLMFHPWLVDVPAAWHLPGN